MSMSLRNTYRAVSGLIKRGWYEEDIGEYVYRMKNKFSQGDFIPEYERRHHTYSKPKISYSFKDNENIDVKLSKKNVEKINNIIKPFGLNSTNSKHRVMKIFSKKIFWKKDIITIAETSESITVDSPDYENSGILLEEIGKVFGAEA